MVPALLDSFILFSLQSSVFSLHTGGTVWVLAPPKYFSEKKAISSWYLVNIRNSQGYFKKAIILRLLQEKIIEGELCIRM